MVLLRLDDVDAIPLATWTWPPDHSLAGQTRLAMGFIVIHPRGLVLVDTGLAEGRPELDAKFRMNRRDLVDYLKERSLDPGAVVAIVNSHLHSDHCGQNRKFPGVPIFAQRAEHALAQQPGYTSRECVDFDGAEYRLLEGDAEILPGIHVLATPGHTPGHQSVLVQTEDGVVILAGHAIGSTAEYVGEVEPVERSTVAQASVQRIRALRPRRVFFGHDAGRWDAD